MTSLSQKASAKHGSQYLRVTPLRQAIPRPRWSRHCVRMTYPSRRPVKLDSDAWQTRSHWGRRASHFAEAMMKTISEMLGDALAAKYQGAIVMPLPDRSVELLTRLDLIGVHRKADAMSPPLPDACPLRYRPGWHRCLRRDQSGLHPPARTVGHLPRSRQTTAVERRLIGPAPPGLVPAGHGTHYLRGRPIRCGGPGSNRGRRNGAGSGAPIKSGPCVVSSAMAPPTCPDIEPALVPREAESSSAGRIARKPDQLGAVLGQADGRRLCAGHWRGQLSARQWPSDRTAERPTGAGGGSRTPTSLAKLRILSPLRLPVPPRPRPHSLYDV